MKRKKKTSEPGRRGLAGQHGFTLVELLVVISISAFLLASLGVAVANYLEMAREQQTISTLEKVDKLISERQKALERAYRRPEFRTFVTQLQDMLKTGNPVQGIPSMPGFSREATEMLARKMFARMLFPQSFSEGLPFTSEDTNGNGMLDTGEDKNNNGVLDYFATPLDRISADATITFNLANHTASSESRRTESSELLYYALTKMEIFGAGPASEEFKSYELIDTDQDGLLEIVDGWGRPIRFYRAPTRLIKPYGALGPDGVAGTPADDDSDGIANNFTELGFVTSSGPSDDHLIHPEWRNFAGLFISGLPRAPVATGVGSVLVNYDQLNQDPDDPYGLLLSEFRRLSKTNSSITPAALVGTEQATSPIWNFPTFDVYHKPLVVSAGPDGELGILEPFPTEDFNGNGTLDAGEDLNGNGQIDLFGHLGIPQLLVQPTLTTPIPTLPPGVATFIAPSVIEAASDNLTNRNRRAGTGR